MTSLGVIKNWLLSFELSEPAFKQINSAQSIEDLDGASYCITDRPSNWNLEYLDLLIKRFGEEEADNALDSVSKYIGG